MGLRKGAFSISGTVASAIAGSQAVVNAAGIPFERVKQSYDAVHAAGAEAIATAAREAGVQRLVHISGIGADNRSSSNRFIKSKVAAEDAIIATILEAYPGHGILAEESGREHGARHSDYVWIIDPLDGTTNFIHGFPQYCVSIAIQHRGVTEHGVVYDPLRQEIFTASRGQGAQLDGRRIRVSKRTTLQQSLVATGFPYRANLMHLDRYMQMLRTVMLESSGVRRPGSAAICDLIFEI